MKDIEVCELINYAFSRLDSTLSLAKEENIDYMAKQNDKVKTVLIKLEQEIFKLKGEQ